MLTEGVGVEPSVALVWVSTAAGVLVTGAGGGAAEHAGDRAGSACQAASGVMHRVRSRDVHEEVLAVGREGQRGGGWGVMGWEGGCWMSEGRRHALN